MHGHTANASIVVMENTAEVATRRGETAVEVVCGTPWDGGFWESLCKDSELWQVPHPALRLLHLSQLPHQLLCVVLIGIALLVT